MDLNCTNSGLSIATPKNIGTTVSINSDAGLYRQKASGKIRTAGQIVDRRMAKGLVWPHREWTFEHPECCVENEFTPSPFEIEAARFHAA